MRMSATKRHLLANRSRRRTPIVEGKRSKVPRSVPKNAPDGSGASLEERHRQRERPVCGQPLRDACLSLRDLAVGALVPVRREQPGAIAGLSDVDAGGGAIRLCRGVTYNRLLRGRSLATPEVRKHVTAVTLGRERRGDAQPKSGNGGK